MAFTNHYFPVLYTEYEKIRALFKDPLVNLRNKMVLRFDFDGTDPQPTLTGFPAKDGGNYPDDEPVLTLSKAPASPVKIDTTFYLGNLEFSRKAFKELKNDPNKKKYVVFIPRKSGVAGYENIVVYYTKWSDNPPTSVEELGPYDIGEELNPSPPRDPQ